MTFAIAFWILYVLGIFNSVRAMMLMDTVKRRKQQTAINIAAGVVWPIGSAIGIIVTLYLTVKKGK